MCHKGPKGCPTAHDLVPGFHTLVGEGRVPIAGSQPISECKSKQNECWSDFRASVSSPVETKMGPSLAEGGFKVARVRA